MRVQLFIFNFNAQTAEVGVVGDVGGEGLDGPEGPMADYIVHYGIGEAPVTRSRLIRHSSNPHSFLMWPL